MRCSRCGNNMPNDAKYCDRCGEPLRKRKNSRYEYDYDDDYDDDEYEYETHRYESQRRNNYSNRGKIGNGILIFLTVIAVCVTILLALNMYLPSKNKVENNANVANNQQQQQVENQSNDEGKMSSNDEGQDEYNNATIRDLSDYYYAVDYYNSNYNSSDGYLFPGSDTRYIDPEELSGCSDSQLAYIRNEIFARHGYIFQTDKYNNYFGSKTWYYPNSYTTDNVNDLNAYEKYNVELIKSLE